MTKWGLPAIIAAGVIGALNVAASSACARAADVTLADPASSLSFSAGYLAQDLGIFKNNGLNVKIIVIRGVGATNAVISGSADFVESAATSISRAAARGQRLLMIAETSDRPSVQIVLRKRIADAHGFDPNWSLRRRAALLRGRVIAVDGVASLVDAYLVAIERRAGLDTKKMRVAIMSPPSMLAAFQRKSIDGFAMPAPWTLVPVAQGSGVLVASGPNGDPANLFPFANSVVATQPKTCRQRRALCVGMGRSFVEAEAYLHRHPGKSLALLRRRFPRLDMKVLAMSFDEVRRISPNPPRINEKGLENAQRLSVEAGLLKPKDEIKSFRGLFTNKFVQ